MYVINGSLTSGWKTIKKYHLPPCVVFKDRVTCPPMYEGLVCPGGGCPDIGVRVSQSQICDSSTSLGYLVSRQDIDRGESDSTAYILD